MIIQVFRGGCTCPSLSKKPELQEFVFVVTVNVNGVFSFRVALIQFQVSYSFLLFFITFTK